MDALYPFMLGAHSWLRWAVLLFGVAAVARALLGVVGKRAWSGADRGVLLAFVSAMDLQFLIGMLLYGVLSPITKGAMADMASAMKDPAVRFFAVEHAFTMILALVFAHVGNVLVKKATVPATRHKRALIFAGIALVLVLAGIPWPGSLHGRPLFFGF